MDQLIFLIFSYQNDTVTNTHFKKKKETTLINSSLWRIKSYVNIIHVLQIVFI